MHEMKAPEWLRSPVARLEDETRLDQPLDALRAIAERLLPGRRGEALRGHWLGHALHPLMTDVPLGCWLAAGLLDLVGGRQSRPAATRLVGLGLLAVPPTVASGLAEVPTISERPTGRVAAAHAIGNSVVAALYLQSWRSRRSGRHARGVALGMAGGVLASITGYLGGHLSFARGVGSGERGLDVAQPIVLPPGDAPPAASADAIPDVDALRS
jgi:uncharacterized membrane protein